MMTYDEKQERWQQIRAFQSAHPELARAARWADAAGLPYSTLQVPLSGRKLVEPTPETYRKLAAGASKILGRTVTVYELGYKDPPGTGVFITDSADNSDIIKEITALFIAIRKTEGEAELIREVRGLRAKYPAAANAVPSSEVAPFPPCDPPA